MQQPDPKHFLTAIFKEINFKAEELNLVLSQFERVEFARNAVLLREGESANFYYFLESGFARSYSVDLRGVDITTKFFGSKDIIIDWQAYFLKTPCKEDVQAVTPCVCWKITFGNFMKLFKIEAFREVGRSCLIRDYFELKNHSLSAITNDATARYLALTNSKPDIAQNVPLRHIATYLGIADTSLSRIRKKIASRK